MPSNSFTRITGYTFPSIIAVVSVSLLLLFNEVNAGNNYYFSSSNGDDSRTSIQARNPATPWKTISKLNSFFSSLAPGDSILFKKGDLFTGTIAPTIPGTLSNPIIISSYGNGAQPVISGFTIITGWTSEGSGIYSKSITVESSPNMVLVNEINTPKGRFPNSGYLTIDSHVTNTTITDADLNSALKNWTGAELVIRKNRYIIERCPITSHSGSTLTYTSPNATYNAIDGYGYFIQNDLRCLDVLGDWAYLSGKFYMYFGSNNPNNYIVKVSALDQLLNVQSGKNYITVNDLSFQGANSAAITTAYTTNVVIKKCSIYFSGNKAIYATSGATNFTIDGCSINQTNYTGIYVTPGTAYTNAQIINNSVRNIGLLPGMTQPAGESFDGIYLSCNNSLIENNYVDSCGFNGIKINGERSNITINNNYVNFCMASKDDGAGIYLQTKTYNNHPPHHISNNIITNCFGNHEGTTASTFVSNGIYLDDQTENTIVTGNTCAYNGGGGIFLGYVSKNLTVKSNTFYDNKYQLWTIRSTGAINPDYDIKNNIFFCPTTSKYLVYIDNLDPSLLGTVDSNYYCRPLNENSSFFMSYPTYHYENLPSWKIAHNIDSHSQTTPVTVTNISDIRFEYNATKSSKSIDLAQTYIGVDNTTYKGNITLLPYSSIILIKIADTSTNHTPSILNQNLHINENTSNGTTVGTIVASDPDAGQTKTFSIVSGNTNNAFVINASTGVLAVANSAALNFESAPSFALVVKVQDNGTGTLSSQATITVSLEDVNEAPSISNQAFSVAENSANGTTVRTIVALDPDAAQTKTFSIVSGNTNGAFAINASTGVLSVANSAALNFESAPSFALVVKVQDNGTGTLSSQATITVSLQDINEAPSISNQAFSIAENAANGTTVGTVIASDPDAAQTKTFSIVSGNTNGAFAINASTGLISVANSAALNFESAPSFALVVKVQDNGTGTLSSQATITVSLHDVNEAPSISNQAFSVAENSANGTTIGTVAASDPDAAQTKTFSIVSGNTNNAFTINASTGVLAVASSSALNFESASYFALLVKVQDNGTVTLSSQATITVSLEDVNEAPSISNQAFSVAENSANGTTVGTVAASDPDASQTKTFSIVSGNTNGAFAINASTGELLVSNYTVLNYSVNTTFFLNVKVNDNGDGNLFDIAIITVTISQETNQTPIISNQSFSIAENTANGTIVGTVVASDPDETQTLTYSIASGDANGGFTINPSTGDIIIADSTVLNFETTPTLALVIKVQDNGAGNLFKLATFTVSLTDINEVPVISNQFFSVSENSANGDIVGKVIASDPDAGQSLYYFIVTGNSNNAFAINALTGELTVNKASVLNHTKNSPIQLGIIVIDNGTGNLSNNAIVEVSILPGTNQPPVISDQTFAISKNLSTGTSVGIVKATDPDTEQVLEYSILAGNIQDAFTINSSTGELLVVNPDAFISDSALLYELTIKVQDNGLDSISNQATITVLVINANTPFVIPDQTKSIAEHQPIGTIVGSISVYDTNFMSPFIFSITSGNINDAFALDEKSGSLIINDPAVVCYEMHPIFNLSVNVKNNEGLTADAILTINVTDINEKPLCNNQVFQILENAPTQRFVGAVIAKDLDFNQTLSYAIVSGNIGDAFKINPNDGSLYVNNSTSLNFEENPEFSLTISVQDNGQGNLTTFSTITIKVLDMNEPPIMENQDLSVIENSLPGTKIGYLKATDPDKGQLVKFMIVSGNNNNTFNLDDSSGLISVADPSKLSYGRNALFALTVIAQDNGADSLSTLSVVTISLVRDSSELVMSEDSLIPSENTFSEKDISIYPNPTADIVNIDLGKIVDETVAIRIFNINGSEIYSSVNKGEKNIAISMEHEGPGIYIASIGLNGKVYSKNFVVKN